MSDQCGSSEDFVWSKATELLHSPKSPTATGVTPTNGHNTRQLKSRIILLQNKNNHVVSSSDDVTGEAGGSTIKNNNYPHEYDIEQQRQKSSSRLVTDDEDDDINDYDDESTHSDESVHFSSEKLKKLSNNSRSPRSKKLLHNVSNGKFPFDAFQRTGSYHNSLTPRQLDRHKSGEESIFESERRRHSVIGAMTIQSSNEGSPLRNGVDRTKSFETHMYVESELRRPRSHHGSLRSGSKRQSGRKAFAVDQLYVPSADDSFSKSDNNNGEDKSHGSMSQNDFRTNSNNKLGNSHTSLNSSQETTNSSNHKSAGSHHNSGSFHHNSYTDINFIRPEENQLLTPKKEHTSENDNYSPPGSNRGEMHQIVQSNAQIGDYIKKTPTSPSRNDTSSQSQPHSPKRVLPKHLHQVFGAGGSEPINASFIPRHLATTQMNKKREKNRLAQYTNSNATNSSSVTNFHGSNASSITNFHASTASSITNFHASNASTMTNFHASTASSMTNFNNSVISSASTMLSQETNGTSSILSNDNVTRTTITSDNNSKSKISPQTYLDTLIRSRGYQTATTASINIRKHRTQLDYGSFGFFTVGVARLGDLETLQTLLGAGLSPNACNDKGESLARIICRRGDFKSLQLMIKYGCDVDSICDDYGRNLLHDACCCMSVSSCLSTVKVILQHCFATKPTANGTDSEAPSNDIQGSSLRLFFRTDSAGALPLSYVRQEHWGYWLQFLSLKKDEYLPDPTSAVSSSVLPKPSAEVVTVQPLPVEVARLVASGKVPPEHARRLAKKLYGKQQLQKINSTNNTNQDQQHEKPTNSTAANEGGKKVIITNMSKNSPLQRQAEGDVDTETSSKGSATLKTIPVPKDQESKFRDIIFYVENTVIREREKLISNKSERKEYFDNDVDSTAYPDDSFSGVEFYCDSYDYRLNGLTEDYRDIVSSSTESENDDAEIVQSFKPSVRYIAPSDDVDSTAYPDSVSGVEFYSEQYVPIEEFGFNEPNAVNQDFEVDSTAFPDSVSGVEFYYDAGGRRFDQSQQPAAKRNESAINQSTLTPQQQPKATNFKGSTHYYDIAPRQISQQSDIGADECDDSDDADDSYGDFHMSASLCTDTATLGSVDDASPIRKKTGKFQSTYNARKYNTQRYVRAMMDEDHSASNNSDSERCVGGSSFNSFLEI